MLDFELVVQAVQDHRLVEVEVLEQIHVVGAAAAAVAAVNFVDDGDDGGGDGVVEPGPEPRRLGC